MNEEVNNNGDDIFENYTTYILYERDNGKIIEQTTPLFESELESNKVEFFDNRYSVESLEESVFKMLYSDEYNKHFKEYWLYYLDSHFQSIGFGFDYYLNEDQNVLESDYFTIVLNKKEGSLMLCFDVDMEVATAACITQILCDYLKDVIPLVISKSYVYDENTEDVFYGNVAYLKKLTNNINYN